MADIYSREKRSVIMSRVRGSGNRSTELRVVELFRRHGIHGWRRNVRISGRPDFVFPRQRIAVFVDGCFWHGCSVHASTPITNRDFWTRKISANKGRDRAVAKALRSKGWNVLRIWQHELKKANEHIVVRRIRSTLARATSHATS
jgi:DNA mismatch endonuclease, patch repair protein